MFQSILSHSGGITVHDGHEDFLRSQVSEKQVTYAKLKVWKKLTTSNGSTVRSEKYGAGVSADTGKRHRTSRCHPPAISPLNDMEDEIRQVLHFIVTSLHPEPFPALRPKPLLINSSTYLIL